MAELWLLCGPWCRTCRIMRYLASSFAGATGTHCQNPGLRKTTVQGMTGIPWCRTILSVKGLCTCKYDYRGTAKNSLVKTEDTSPLMFSQLGSVIVSRYPSTRITICTIFQWSTTRRQAIRRRLHTAERPDQKDLHQQIHMPTYTKSTDA